MRVALLLLLTFSATACSDSRGRYFMHDARLPTRDGMLSVLVDSHTGSMWVVVPNLNGVRMVGPVELASAIPAKSPEEAAALVR